MKARQPFYISSYALFTSSPAAAGDGCTGRLRGWKLGAGAEGVEYYYRSLAAYGAAVYGLRVAEQWLKQGARQRRKLRRLVNDRHRSHRPLHHTEFIGLQLG
jgi:hypothetical protein